METFFHALLSFEYSFQRIVKVYTEKSFQLFQQLLRVLSVFSPFKGPSHRVRNCPQGRILRPRKTQTRGHFQQGLPSGRAPSYNQVWGALERRKREKTQTSFAEQSWNLLVCVFLVKQNLVKSNWIICSLSEIIFISDSFKLFSRIL